MRRDPRERPAESTLEDEWIEALALRGVTGLVRQFEVMTEDGPKRVDVAKPEVRRGIELDSKIWHASEESTRSPPTC